MSAPRNPALESALLIIELLQRIPRSRFTTTTHLHEQIEAAGHRVSRRTVQRHLDAIVERFPIESDTRSRPYGYRWREGVRGLNLPLLTPSEALLLHLAQKDLTHLMPSKTLASLAPLFSSARRELDLPCTPGNERRWLKKIQRIPDSQPMLAPRIAPAVFELVSDALYRERKLGIRYRNAQNRIKDATICPLGLVQQGLRLYLICQFESFDNQRILALPRILSAQVLPEGFDWPANFDLARYCQEGHFGIHLGRRVRISFVIEAASGQHLLESPLSRDQTARLVDGCLAIVATVEETELLHRWLRGWGDKLRDLVIEPLTGNT